MYRDVLYAVSAWMRRNGDVQGWQKIAGKFVPDIFNRLYPYSHPAFSALPPSMAVVRFGCIACKSSDLKAVAVYKECIDNIIS